MRKLLGICIAFMVSVWYSQCQSFIDFSGMTQNRDLGGIPWVGGTTMWESIETGDGMATFVQGIPVMEALNPMLLTWTFGDLELIEANSRSPRPMGSPTPPPISGVEFYSENDGSVVPLEFSYDGTLWATGEIQNFIVNVDDDADFTATGTGVAMLTAPGPVEREFFDDIDEISGGTRLLNFTINNFDPVDANGLFSSTGTILVAAVPEPQTYGLFAIMICAALVMVRMRTKQQRECTSQHDLN